LTPAGLPVGLQIVGPRFADALVMRAAAAFLDAKPFQAAAFPLRPPSPIGRTSIVQNR
jgi:aspartyl-tRNA(Asn)/glutamyl-tRNA(Gln) amidotransferase subunit A